MTSKPKVSVIVPVYNVEQYIEQCIKSLVNQSLTDIEIVVIDDCGTDASMQIVEKYAKSDKRIKIIKNDRNSGLSASRNNGIAHSTAPYIMCCDSDDFYDTKMCEQMYNAITKNHADIAMCGTNVIYDADKELKESDDTYYKIKFDGVHDVTDDIVKNCDVSSWNKIFKREILDKYDIRYPVGLKYEDAYFFAVYMLWAKKICFVPDKLYNYRRRAGSIMNQTFKKNSNLSIDHLYIAIQIYEYLKKFNLVDKKQWLFWESFFVPYLYFTLTHAGNFKIQSKIIKLAQKFIRENPPDLSSVYILHMVDTILDGYAPYFWTPRLFGLVQIKKSIDATRIKIFGVYLYKIEHKEKYNRHSLLGVHLFNTHTPYDSVYKIPRLREYRLDNGALLSALQQMDQFTYIPNPGNMGDMLIAFGTLGFFDENNIQYKMYTGNPDANIVYGGGGIWTHDYEQHWSKFLPVFKQAKKVVILPSSFNNCQKLIDILDHRFTIFCREKRSYDYLKSQNTTAKIILDHDMAFRIKNSMLVREICFDQAETRLTTKLRATKINRTEWFTRTDCECAGNYKSDMDLSSYVYGSETAPRQWINASAMLMLETVARARTVITDRLHVAIAASLVSSDVYMLDNTYGKLSAVYEHSMKDRPQVHFCKSISEIPIDEQD